MQISLSASPALRPHRNRIATSVNNELQRATRVIGPRFGPQYILAQAPIWYATLWWSLHQHSSPSAFFQSTFAATTMGADSQMPYLYGANEQSSRNLAYPYSHFNPKAVTEASYKRLSQQTTDTSKSKQEGPLINFNQHPDSYVVFDSRKTDHKPLPPRTKSAVKGVRWALFGVRLVQEIAALGLLVGTICMEGTSGGQTYLLRVPVCFVRRC